MKVSKSTPNVIKFKKQYYGYLGVKANFAGQFYLEKIDTIERNWNQNMLITIHCR